MDTSSLSVGRTLLVNLEPHRGHPLPDQLPSIGRLTWFSEGTSREDSPYYSRRAHVPGPTSGVTIGRGYDLKLRSASEITRDLMAAGLHKSAAEKFAEARGLSGTAARKFLSTHPLPELSAAQELALFQISWMAAKDDVIRVSRDAANVQLYGKVDFESLDPTILELLVDLRFRGDYTPVSRSYIQPLVVQNDRKALASVMADRALWSSVPYERFAARAAFIEETVRPSPRKATRVY